MILRVCNLKIHVKLLNHACKTLVKPLKRVSKSRIIDLFLITKIRLFEFKLESVTGPVIQANGRLTF